MYKYYVNRPDGKTILGFFRVNSAGMIEGVTAAGWKLSMDMAPRLYQEFDYVSKVEARRLFKKEFPKRKLQI